MQLAETPQHDLIECRIVFEDQRRVLRGQRMQRIRELLHIVVLLRTNREAEHGPGQIDQLQVIVILIVRIVQHRVVIRFFDPRDRAEVARQRNVCRHMLRAIQFQ